MKHYRFYLLAGVGFTHFALLTQFALGAADSCAQKAELKATSYPRNDDEWHTRCTASTKTCLETWKTLALARAQVEDDYRLLCGHLAQAADVSSCDRNCLDNAAVGLRQALADTQQTEADVDQLRKAALGGRKQNLLFAATLIDQRRNGQASAEPRCWGDFRISLRVVSFLWAERAMAAGPPLASGAIPDAPSGRPATPTELSQEPGGGAGEAAGTRGVPTVSSESSSQPERTSPHKDSGTPEGATGNNDTKKGSTRDPEVAALMPPRRATPFRTPAPCGGRCSKTSWPPWRR